MLFKIWNLVGIVFGIFLIVIMLAFIICIIQAIFSNNKKGKHK